MTQVAAVAAVRSLKRVRVFGRHASAAARGGTICEELGVQTVEETSVADAVNGAPIVTAVTRAARAVSEWNDGGSRRARQRSPAPSRRAGPRSRPSLLARCTRVVVDQSAAGAAPFPRAHRFLGTRTRAVEGVRPLSAFCGGGRRQRERPETISRSSKSLEWESRISRSASRFTIRRKRAGLGRPLTHPAPAAPTLSAPATPSRGHENPRRGVSVSRSGGGPLADVLFGYRASTTVRAASGVGVGPTRKKKETP